MSNATTPQEPDTEAVALSDDDIPVGSPIYVDADDGKYARIYFERGTKQRMVVALVRRETAQQLLQTGDPKRHRKFAQRVLRNHAWLDKAYIELRKPRPPPAAGPARADLDPVRSGAAAARSGPQPAPAIAAMTPQTENQTPKM